MPVINFSGDWLTAWFKESRIGIGETAVATNKAISDIRIDRLVALIGSPKCFHKKGTATLNLITVLFENWLILPIVCQV